MWIPARSGAVAYGGAASPQLRGAGPAATQRLRQSPVKPRRFQILAQSRFCVPAFFRKQGFAPWMTYVSGVYCKFLFHHEVQLSRLVAARHASIPVNPFPAVSLPLKSLPSRNTLNSDRSQFSIPGPVNRYLNDAAPNVPKAGPCKQGTGD